MLQAVFLGTASNGNEERTCPLHHSGGKRATIQCILFSTQLFEVSEWERKEKRHVQVVNRVGGNSATIINLFLEAFVMRRMEW